MGGIGGEDGGSRGGGIGIGGVEPLVGDVGDKGGGMGVLDEDTHDLGLEGGRGIHGLITGPRFGSQAEAGHVHVGGGKATGIWVGEVSGKDGAVGGIRGRKDSLHGFIRIDPQVQASDLPWGAGSVPRVSRDQDHGGVRVDRLGKHLLIRE